MTNELRDLAHYVGLCVDTWSPGDGVTRYRFFTKCGSDYFAGDGIYTALGRKEAMTFLRGFTAGMNATLDRFPTKVRFKYGYPSNA